MGTGDGAPTLGLAVDGIRRMIVPGVGPGWKEVWVSGATHPRRMHLPVLMLVLSCVLLKFGRVTFVPLPQGGGVGYHGGQHHEYPNTSVFMGRRSGETAMKIRQCLDKMGLRCGTLVPSGYPDNGRRVS